MLGAGHGAVHNGVAAVQLELVVERAQAFFGVLVTRVRDPAVGLRQNENTYMTRRQPTTTTHTMTTR